jgi:hypothetical protein
MNAKELTRLPWTLFLMRVSVFVVFLIWTLDKFLRPDHAASVYQKFYFTPALSAAAMYVLGAIEVVILAGFLLGVRKKLTYGIVLLLHLISTVSSYKQYLAPFESMHILFFAAIPMLAACYTLYVLRDHDTMLILPLRERGKEG